MTESNLTSEAKNNWNFPYNFWHHVSSANMYSYGILQYSIEYGNWHYYKHERYFSRRCATFRAVAPPLLKYLNHQKYNSITRAKNPKGKFGRVKINPRFY
jgi:hypothetical protein